jgi:hypothetical protein
LSSVNRRGVVSLPPAAFSAGDESATIALITDLHGVSNVRHGPKFYEVQRRINAAIGADMVQHGPEDEYTGHSDDSIFVFGPQGEYEELRGMAQVQSWYDKFRRKTLDAHFRGGVPAEIWRAIDGGAPGRAAYVLATAVFS